jgi:hypothetical protein
MQSLEQCQVLYFDGLSARWHDISFATMKEQLLKMTSNFEMLLQHMEGGNVVETDWAMYRIKKLSRWNNEDTGYADG